MSDSNASEGRIPFRVRIGVTGHRDPIDTKAATAAIRSRLREVSERFPDNGSTKVSFLLLSALAEGGDRLVAEQALEVLRHQGVELRAVLPMSEQEYRKDFPRSVQAFEEFLRPPTIKVELPAAEDRDEAYEHAGRYIVDHSDVVIALWDGHPPKGRGGSAETVGYARRQGVPVLVVTTRRAREPDREPRSPDWALEPWTFPDSSLDSYERIEEFNAGSNHDRAMSRLVEREQERLGGPAEGSPIHWQYDVVANWAVPRLVRADSLAMKYQHLYYRLGGSLYVLAALAVTAIAAESQWKWSAKVALVEVGFMLGLLAVYGIARHIRVHERWIGYRSLAEAFRSALFIVLSGVHQRIDDSPGKLCAIEEPWFQRVFSEAWTDRPAVELQCLSAGELRQLLIQAWLEDQIRYHRRAVKRFQRGRQRLTRIVFLLFSTTVVVGLLHAFDVANGSISTKVLTFLAIALPAFGAALVGIRDQRQYRVHEDRSGRTASRLQRLRRDMESRSTLRSVQQLAAQIQTLIEAENLDWSGVIEFQDLEMVV